MNIETMLLQMIESGKEKYQTKFDIFNSKIETLKSLDEKFDFDRSPNKNFTNIINKELKEYNQRLEQLFFAKKIEKTF